MAWHRGHANEQHGEATTRRAAPVQAGAAMGSDTWLTRLRMFRHVAGSNGGGGQAREPEDLRLLRNCCLLLRDGCGHRRSAGGHERASSQVSPGFGRLQCARWTHSEPLSTGRFGVRVPGGAPLSATAMQAGQRDSQLVALRGARRQRGSVGRPDSPGWSDAQPYPRHRRAWRNGRRARFRSWWGNTRGSSSLPARTTPDLR